MVSKLPPDLQLLLSLLQKLGKVEPAYPYHLLMRRREAFLSHALKVKMHYGGGNVAAASSKEFLTQVVIGVVLAGEIALGAYLLRDYWLPLLGANPTPTAAMPVIAEPPSPLPQPTATPIPTETAAPTASMLPAWTSTPPFTPNEIQPETTEEKGNQGKHLGQTPGAPNAPGQDPDKDKNKDKDKKP